MGNEGLLECHVCHRNTCCVIDPRKIDKTTMAAEQGDVEPDRHELIKESQDKRWGHIVPDRL